MDQICKVMNYTGSLCSWGLVNKASLMSLKYQEAYRCHIDEWLRNTIRDGGSSTALCTAYTDDTVDTVCSNQTALHCLNSGMFAYIVKEG